MEEERFVINNEEINQNTIDVKENNQNTIDIEENISDVPYKETIQIIEVDEPEIYNIDSDEAFSSLGEQNEQLNHNLMQLLKFYGSKGAPERGAVSEAD